MRRVTGRATNQCRSLNDQSQFLNTITIDPVDVKFWPAFARAVISQAHHQLQGTRPQRGELDIRGRWVGARCRMRMIEADVETVAFVSDYLNKVSAVDLEPVTGGR